MANRWENNENSDRLYLGGGSKITADGDCSHEIKRQLPFGRKVMTNVDRVSKSRDIMLYSQNHVFSNSHVQMEGLDHKEG